MALGECTECMPHAACCRLYAVRCSQLATCSIQLATYSRLPVRPIKPGKSAYFTCQDFRKEEQVQDVRRSPLDRFMEFATASSQPSASASARNKSHWLGQSIFCSLFLFFCGKVKGIYRKIPSERTRLVGGHAISGQLRTINEFWWIWSRLAWISSWCWLVSSYSYVKNSIGINRREFFKEYLLFIPKQWYFNWYYWLVWLRLFILSYFCGDLQS